MNTDFRISIGFSTNIKIKRIIRRHGEGAILALLKLWEFAALHRPRGILHGMTKLDILDVSEWRGDEEFVDTLIEVGLLDEADGAYKIHDWKDHNSYAFHAPERSESARKAAEAKWGKK